MTISELVEKLQFIEDEYGDLPVILPEGQEIGSAAVVDLDDTEKAVEIT